MKIEQSNKPLQRCRFGAFETNPNYLKICGEKVGAELVPIGNYDISGVIVMMDSKGRVFGGLEETDDILWFIGTSANDAINKIVGGESGKRIV